MRTRCVVAALLAVVLGCRGDGAFEIKRKVTSERIKATGVPSEHTGTLADTRPSLRIDGITGPLAEGMRGALEKSRTATKGGLGLTVTLDPASPRASGRAHARIDVTAMFAHPPQLTRLTGTLDIQLTFENVSPRRIGQELGDAVVGWIDDAKLPGTLGVSTGPVPKATGIAAGDTSCTLHEDGSVRCWEREAKDAMLVPAAASSIAVDAAANFGACGVYKDGRVWCLDAWDGARGFEVREVCGVAKATDVSVGQATACALLGTGKVACWPRRKAAYAPCGSTRAAEISGIADATSLESGSHDGCVVKKDGTVACWQHCDERCNSHIGGSIDVSQAPRATAVKGIAGAKQIVYAFQPCAWVGDDRVVCGARGDQEARAGTVPEKIAKLVRGRSGPCALTTQGNLYCAGGRGAIQFEKVAVAHDIVDASGGISGTCGVTSKDEVSCWAGMSDIDPPRAIARPF